MSQQTIRGALQARLLTLAWDGDDSPISRTSFEGKTFVPDPDVAYQRVDTIWAAPLNNGLGTGFAERGVVQVSLRYPLAPVDGSEGVGPQTARAEAIRDLFPVHQRLVDGNGKLICKIVRTAEITRLGAQGDRDVTIVRIRFIER